MDEYMKKYPTPAEYNAMLQAQEKEIIQRERARILALIVDEIEYHKLKIKAGWEDSRHVTPVLHKLRDKIEDGDEDD